MSRGHCETEEHAEPRIISISHDGVGLPRLLIVSQEDPMSCHTYPLSMHRIRLLLADLAQYNLKKLPE